MVPDESVMVAGTSSLLIVSTVSLVAAIWALIAAIRWCWYRRLVTGRAPGPNRIAGTVAPGSGLHVEIDEERIVVGRSGTRSRWRERSRRVSHVPFHIIDESGAGVCVEPTASLQLMRSLELAATPSPTQRTRIASIVPGDRVEVHGHLTVGFHPTGDGYPRQSEGPVLRAPTNGRIVVSLGSVAGILLPLARLHARWFAVLLLWWVALVVAILGRFILLRASGHEVLASVEHCEQMRETSRSGAFYRYHLVAATEQSGCSGKSIDDYTNEATCWRAQQEQGLRVPFVVAANCRSYQLGPRASVRWGLLVGLIIGNLPIGFLYMHYAQKRQPWYLQTRTLEEV